MSHEGAADRFSLAIAWGGLGLLAYLVYLVTAPFLAALGWAAVFAILFHPLHARLVRHTKPGLAALATTLIVAAVLIAPLVVLAMSVTQQAVDAAGRLQGAMSADGGSRLTTIWREVERRLPALVRNELNTSAGDVVRGLGTFLVNRSGFVARSALGFVGNLVTSLFATFFLLRDGDRIMRGVRQLLPMPPDASEALITRTRELIEVGVVSSLVVAAVQGLLGGVVFAVLGLNGPMLWGAVMALCCLLPFGAWVVWLPAAIGLGLNGDVTRALLLVGLGFGIVSGVDNVLRPMLLSGRADMNGLVVFIGLLGGVAAFGLLGLVLGPILIVTAQALLDSYLETAADGRRP